MLVTISLVVRGFFVVGINVTHVCDLESKIIFLNKYRFNILSSCTELEDVIQDRLTRGNVLSGLKHGTLLSYF